MHQAKAQPRMHLIDREGARRTIWPADEGTQLHQPPERQEARWSLPEFYRQFVKPKLTNEGKSKARLTEYSTAVKRWADCFDSQNSESKNNQNPPGNSELRMGHPLLYQVTPATLSTYRDYLLRENVPPGSADKNVATIVAILSRAEKAWIIPRLPTIKALTRPAVGMLFTFQAAELDELYQAAGQAAWPQKTSGGHQVDIASYWRLFLVGGWNYGFRPQEWWRFDSRREDVLTWSGVVFDSSHTVHGRKMENESGWIQWKQTKTGRPMVLPMNPVIRNHFQIVFDGLPSKPAPGDRVFPFAKSSGTAKGSQAVYPSSGFYSCWWDLVKRAGIEPEIKTADSGRQTHQTHAPKHFRKTARTLHQTLIGSAANWITGHLAKSVGERNYFNAIDEVTRSLHTVKQPKSFERIPDATRTNKHDHDAKA